MTIGRQAELTGEGTLRIKRDAKGASGKAGEGGGIGSGQATINSASFFGSFSSFRGFAAAGGGLSAASWRRSNPYMRLVAIAGVCNRARFAASTGEDDDHPADGKPARTHVAVPMMASERKVLGDASDAAFLRFVDSIIPTFELRLAFPALFEIPFNSVNKWCVRGGAAVRALVEARASPSRSTPTPAHPSA